MGKYLYTLEMEKAMMQKRKGELIRVMSFTDDRVVQDIAEKWREWP